MHNSNVTSLRRSSRVPIAVPILVTSLAPGSNFSEVCDTLVVSAHGCAMRSPVKLEAGAPLHFHSQEGRETTAKVVYCQPIEADRQSWMLGARFDRPDNFWGLQTSPKDWTKLQANGGANMALVRPSADVLPPSQATASAKIVLDRIKKQLSDERLKALLGELVHPIEADLSTVKEKIANNAKQNRFEVSLGQIPPELEEQLELRLRKELEPRVLQEARDQYDHLLCAAAAAIDQKTSESHGEFLQRLGVSLQEVEQRARSLSNDVAHHLREHLNRGVGEFHQEVIDAGNRLKRLSEDLLHGMEYRLDEVHQARRYELEQVQATFGAESSRLHEQFTDLDARMAEINESIRGLEAGLDKRLSQMSSDTVRSTRGQLESALEAALADLATRNAIDLGNQLDEAKVSLSMIQRGIEAAVCESLKVRIAETLQSFDRSLEESAQQSLERVRLALAGALNSFGRNLDEQFRLPGGPRPNSVKQS